MPTGPDDNSFISSALQGNQQAYAALVQRYQDFVFTVCLRYAVTREDAEEIAQDVFVKAWRSLADFRGESKFSTWLYTIAYNSCLTFLRKKRPGIHSLDDEKVMAAAGNIHNGQGAGLAEQKSKIAMVNTAIRLLSADDAKLLLLFYRGGQSLDEIGRVLGIEPNTAKVKLHRARQRLKEKMETYFAQEVKDLV
jgi:RNA polymerase sigma-70 factor (ECF subfamily)